MFSGIFGGDNKIRAKSEGTENKKRIKVVILLIVAAICLLTFGGDGKKTEEKTTDTNNAACVLNPTEYADEIQKRLKSVLSEIKGAGNVEVMISFDTMNEKVLATNNKSEKMSDAKDGENTSSTDSEENIMLYGSGSNEQPFVIKEKLPSPSGVLVLAAGAENEKVKMEIYESVKALYGLPAHRIKVARLNVK